MARKQSSELPGEPKGGAYRGYMIEYIRAQPSAPWHVTKSGFHIGWFRTKEEAEQTIDMLTE